jgi:branched-chain amino acid transport system permease protein
MNYVLHLITIFCLYAALVQSLNLCVGYGGMLSLCHAAFYGVGAYVSTLLLLNAGWPFAISLAVAMISTGLLAWLVSLPASRLRGDFFILATLGFQMITFAVLYNWVDVTNGPQGIPGVPRPSLFGIVISTPLAFVILAVAVAALCCGLVWWLVASPYGRTLQAVREDEIAAASLGKDVNAFKRSAFTWAGAVAAVPGVLFATYSSYIDPTSFGLEESIFILCMLVIGGAGNIQGPLIGAIVLTLFPELLRFLGLHDSIAANLRQILYGLAIVVMMRMRPQGIAGKYAFDK